MEMLLERVTFEFYFSIGFDESTQVDSGKVPEKILE